MAKKIKIMLDAGHYGLYNRSPVNNRYYESNMNWKLHGYLKQELEKYGIFTVGVTRKNKHTDMPVYDRGRMAKGYNLFISIHSNAADDESVDYPVAYVSYSGKVDVLAKRIIDSVRKVMKTKQKSRVNKRTYISGGVTYDYYGVIRGAASVKVPAILIEHSFHTNKKATAFLLDDSNLKQIAKSEAKVLYDYYKGSISKDGDSFRIKLKEPLNIHSKASLSSKTTGVAPIGVYTIIDTKKDGTITVGKLASGAGWISLHPAYSVRL